MRLTIRLKLFLTLLLASGLVSLGMFGFIRWSFDRGFLDYVNRQRLAEVEQLAPRLAERYARHGSWRFLAEDPRAWGEVLRSVGRPEPAPPRPPEPAPPPRIGRGLPVALYDANRRVVIGPPDQPPADHLRPVTVDGRTVGYLGLVRSRELYEAGDLLFLERQTQAFAGVALGVAALSLLLAFPLTAHLLRPIQALAAGTRKLAAGDYATRIEPTTRDELGQLCRGFNDLAFALEKNEQARRQWVADIAHELRTPLTVLRGDLEALQDGVRAFGPDTLGALHDETVHLARLVDDLYELSMSDVGALTYRFRPVDPVAALEEAVERHAPRFEAAGLDLRLRARGAGGVLSADPDRLQQLFHNLLENALRYTEAPGVVEVTAGPDSEGWTVEFADSPPGIDPAHHEKLFDRLYRGEASRNRATGGAGLGLAICRNIVEAHRGEIRAGASRLGGLGIRITLPLSTGDAP